MRPRWPDWQFRRLRTRLAVRYAMLFALALFAVAAAAQVMVWGHARQSVRAAMATSGSVYDRLWALRAQSLEDSAGVLAHDFGFRAAVASGDAPTIHSALVNLGNRVGVSDTFLLDPSGKVIGGGTPALRKEIANLSSLGSGRQDAVIAGAGGVYRVVATPVMAPTQIGLVLFALPLDAREMSALAKLSAIPLTATMLRRDRAGHWTTPDGTIGARRRCWTYHPATPLPSSSLWLVETARRRRRCC